MRTKTPREAYDAPKCEIIEILNEGVLCASGEHDSYEEEYFIW